MADAPLRIKIEFSGTPILAFEKKRLKALMRSAGTEIAALARALIRRSARGGRVYRGSGGNKYRPYRPGRYSASAPGEAPANVTGTLARSIKVRPFKSGEGVAIRDTMFYALFLERGARGGGRKRSAGQRVRGKSGTATDRVLLPRPFLSTALERRQSSIGERLKAAVLDGIEFRRMKA